MNNFNPSQKNPPWVRSTAVQQQPLLAQQMTVQSVALSQPLTTTTHLAQNQLGQVQITPTIQGQVQLPLTQAHLSLNQQLTPTFGQVQINQAQLANIATIHQHPQAPSQTYFTPSISLQQNVGLPQGTIQIQPSSVVIPTSMTTPMTSIAPPGLAIPTTLATTQSTSGTYNLTRISTAPPPLPPQPVKQRVFSGTVTKLHENFGFIDDDVVFQMSTVKGLMPQVGDRVLVEASYNSTMPIKWNATRVQVIAPPLQQAQQAQKFQTGSAPSLIDAKQTPRDWLNRSRPQDTGHREPNDRSNSKSRDPASNGSQRSRDRRASRSPSRSPSRKRSRSPASSRSPPARRRRNVPRYSVQIPKVSLDCQRANLVELRRRYSHMYVPSDFVDSAFWWSKSFPASRPIPLDRPVSFHIFDKDVDPPEENTTPYEPQDADYSFSAKVMLMSVPSPNEMQRRCCPDDDREFVHPARLIRFLVGTRGKNETMAIGGPWSPSLDGADPKNDPQVLIRTAIRTCRALTGIDLSRCTSWYRVAEIHYHRVSSLKNRIETVLLFVPDVWSCVPTADQWEDVVRSYLQPLPTLTASSAASGAADPEAKIDDETTAEPEAVEPRKEATHHTKLDPKTMKIGELRAELDVRNLNSKGFRTQLIPRLTIALKAEADEERRRLADETSPTATAEDEEESSQDAAADPPVSVEDRFDRMDFAAYPQLLVHPSRTAKNGKFNCSLVSLSVLLDYRPEDTKEHTFEVSLFSELFNEMLMRDFGMLVYRSVQNESLRKASKERKEDEESAGSDQKKAKALNLTLQLAYSYFDLSHCHYIASKDLEDLFLTLGMNLSRAQVRKMVQKVAPDDSLRYRKLADMALSTKTARIPKEEPEETTDWAAECEANDAEKLNAPVSDSAGSGGTVLVNGCYVNVEQLMQRLHESESNRRETEARLRASQNQLGECRKNLSKATETINTLCQQLEEEKRHLETTRRDHQSQIEEMTNRYVEGVTKMRSLADSLLSSGLCVAPQSSTPLAHVVVKDEASDLQPDGEYHDKIDH